VLVKGIETGCFCRCWGLVGFYILLAVKHELRVVTFEPNLINVILLRYNIALHIVGDRVVVVGKAVGEVHGQVSISISPSSSESSFTKYLKSELKLRDTLVEVTTIDFALEPLGVKFFDSLVMKIEVESFSLRVLREALETIERFMPFILFEAHRTLDEEDEIHALKNA
jgi:FkbM family methyltransferase